jgi:IS30 family transposase
VSLSTIYRAVARGDLDLPGAGSARRRLRRRGRRLMSGREEARGKIHARHELSERPAEADARSRLGDWEADTVVGPGGACLVTLVDRASRLLVGGLSASRSSSDVGDVEVAALSGRPLRTVTPDRGKELANNAEVSERLGGVQFYFCEPHHPWQKGANENTNGLLREFFPKGTDFSRVTDEEVARAYELINDRPRKVLGYRTANEVYREMLHSA